MDTMQIERWQRLKEIEKDAKEERIRLENSWFEKDRMDGQSVFPVGEKELVVKYKSVFLVDQEKAAFLDSQYDNVPFRKKYDLDKKLYDSIEKLNKDAFVDFSKAVTRKPGRPSFEIKELK